MKKLNTFLAIIAMSFIVGCGGGGGEGTVTASSVVDPMTERPYYNILQF